MRLLYIEKQLVRCSKIYAAIFLNICYTFHNAGCHSTSFTSMGQVTYFFFKYIFFTYLESASTLWIFYISAEVTIFRKSDVFSTYKEYKFVRRFNFKNVKYTINRFFFNKKYIPG